MTLAGRNTDFAKASLPVRQKRRGSTEIEVLGLNRGGLRDPPTVPTESTGDGVDVMTIPSKSDYPHTVDRWPTRRC